MKKNEYPTLSSLYGIPKESFGKDKYIKIGKYILRRPYITRDEENWAWRCFDTWAIFRPRSQSPCVKQMENLGLLADAITECVECYVNVHVPQNTPLIIDGYDLMVPLGRPSHAKLSMFCWWGETNLSIPKLQRPQCWSLIMDKQFHPAFYNGCIHWSMLELKFIFVCERVHDCMVPCTPLPLFSHRKYSWKVCNESGIITVMLYERHGVPQNHINPWQNKRQWNITETKHIRVHVYRMYCICVWQCFTHKENIWAVCEKSIRLI